MPSIARNVSALASVLVLVFAIGFGAGIYVAPQLTAESASSGHDHAGHAHAATAAHDDFHSDHEDHAAHGEGDHIDLTEQAYYNLGLKFGDVQLQDYWKSQAVPGEVVEIPGTSSITVSAPVNGVIEGVTVRPGETVQSTDNLFSLRITDEFLTSAQSKLLAGMARMDILRREITRLAPLTAAGAVVGRKKRDLEYELTQLESTQRVLHQEMQSRGLPELTIANVIRSRTLASTLQVSATKVADRGRQRREGVIQSIAFQQAAPLADYIVERLNVQSGQTVTRGEAMCTLSNHAELYIRGQAFESDLPLLQQMTEKGWGIRAEFGHDHDSSDENTTVKNDLRVLRVENTVGSESQTLSFFLPLQNEKLSTLRDQKDRAFTHWRFKPGQRVHLRLPVEKWENQIVVPLDAVVIEGPNVKVFAQAVAGEEDSAEADPHAEPGHAAEVDAHAGHDHGPGVVCEADHDVFITLEPVDVRLLHRDDRVAVIANDGQLVPGRRIALNSAYKLDQAMKMNAGGGGGGHHGHEH